MCAGVVCGALSLERQATEYSWHQNWVLTRDWKGVFIILVEQSRTKLRGGKSCEEFTAVENSQLYVASMGQAVIPSFPLPFPALGSHRVILKKTEQASAQGLSNHSALSRNARPHWFCLDTHEGPWIGPLDTIDLDVTFR